MVCMRSLSTPNAPSSSNILPNLSWVDLNVLEHREDTVGKQVYFAFLRTMEAYALQCQT